ncbi:[Fe-Fe] hydrogenase large subunit C-terminal domain-containing protein [Chitinispirillales bacterium ANBcel5]|uniref:[Fe-Fe] hydrogenase large subunit C-terminal domain-containing protein n=1 Tax=Cellulosispirillum alkaliphilum TaxID=3039283 RepID=UPI002A589260|nr:[Fe-Fe] hydrogenase large subunit C-terminal domain-containing protein [Chitinispirillales bacterium ANBcel5]
MHYLNPIYSEETHCRDCYKCIRECPVKAIRVVNGEAEVIPESCILCGHCVDACPVGAKKVRDDLRRSIHLTKRKKKSILSLAPSFAGEFTNTTTGQLIHAIKRLGFYGVSETALGAQEVSYAVGDMINKESGLILSSACPAAVDLITKHLTKFSQYISPVLSPLLAHSIMLRHLYGQELGIVFAGPCIAKKQEADKFSDLLDIAITFEDLKKWFDANGIRSSEQECDETDVFIPRSAQNGSVYPVEGGMISTIRNRVRDSDAVYLTLSGVSNIRTALETLDDKLTGRKMFVELLACENGCVAGPKATNRATIDSRLSVLDYASTKSESCTGDFREKIGYTFGAKQIAASNVTHEQICDTLASVGKSNPEDELNCGSCGYGTCREFAIAMIEKKAEQCMCVSFMRSLAQKKANALLKTIPYGVVIVDRELRIIECNDNFAKALGDDVCDVFKICPGLRNADLKKVLPFHGLFSQVLTTGNDITQHFVKTQEKTFALTIFTVELHQVAGALIRDATKTELRREQIIEKAQEVIRNTSATAQEIAFLMGKNAAQSEKILNSLTESFS